MSTQQAQGAQVLKVKAYNYGQSETKNTPPRWSSWGTVRAVKPAQVSQYTAAKYTTAEYTAVGGVIAELGHRGPAAS